MADTPEAPEAPPRGNPAVPVNIEDEMRRSFLDYSMSVIISRALPDVRDGFSPSRTSGRARLMITDLE